MSLDKYASKIEQTIVNAIVDSALSRGYSISVYDGEEYALRRSTDKRAILDAVCSTDHDTLRFYNGDRKVGWVLLIWGNGCDLISDWSDTDAMGELLNPIIDSID